MKFGKVPENRKSIFAGLMDNNGLDVNTTAELIGMSEITIRSYYYPGDLEPTVASLYALQWAIHEGLHKKAMGSSE